MAGDEPQVPGPGAPHPGGGGPRHRQRGAGRSMWLVALAGVVILLALAVGLPVFLGAPSRPSGHRVATPTPAATVSPGATPSATATAGLPAEPGPLEGSLGPPPAGAPVPSSSTVVYLNGPSTIQVYSAPDASRRASSLPGHNSIDQPSAFLVLDQQPGWFHVLLPVKPNGSTGWLKASDVQVATTSDYLRVTLSQFRIDHYVGGTWQGGYRVALGKPETPTPTGLFYILASQVVNQPPYTPGIFALSGFSPQPIPGFLGATLGVHGWTDSSVIGTRASNGCVRLASKDMDPLLHHLILGTPVDIVA